ncbi:MAG: GH92 family glycosyl hydrolase [Paludibacter sp.]|nr:GH92 family glycosyl hydrolase [Paludibacter sp.]
MNRLLIFTLTILFCNSSIARPKQPADYVNPFIGATTSVKTAGTYHGLGKTFPGATLPFGMVQVSPNTITGGDNGSGYSYEHKTIEGFAFTQMSGVGWYGDLGNFLVMPSTGKRFLISGNENDTLKRGYRSFYDKKSEKASAGYYSVNLNEYSIKTEATATSHCGMLRFTFPENKQSRIQIDLARRIGGTSTSQYVQVVDSFIIRGWMRCTPEGGGWGHGAGNADYTVYFYARFSKPLRNYGCWSADISTAFDRNGDNALSEKYLSLVEHSPVFLNFGEKEGKHVGFFTEFATKQNEVIEVSAGLSFVDMAGAENNYNCELKGKSFDEVRADARKTWNKALNKIVVEGTNEQKVIFYTALYHTMIDPRIVSDADGRYTGGGNKIYQAVGFQKRTIFSGWDVFRSQMPLQTILNPTLVNDELNSLITLAEESGKNYFERWELLNAYSGCMIGNPAVSVLADAYEKGIRKYDVAKAYRFAVNNSAMTKEDDKNGFWGAPYSISNTLEYSYDDWCLSRLSAALGHTDHAAYYFNKSLNYKNIFDKSHKWFRARKTDGTWEPWPEEGRLKDWYGCIESNPYQQGWFVPHDIKGMVELMGGTEKVKDDLICLFEKTPLNLRWNSYYNHANEQVHHVPFLFNRIGYPWLTQKWSRFVCENAYKNSVEGLVGNEDVGQMSAWYVLASTGLYQVCPGDTRFELTSPVFKKVTFHLDNGKSFIIKSDNQSKKHKFIRKAKLNDKNFDRCFIDYKTIMNGGSLHYTMSGKPTVKWGVSDY